MFTVSKMAARQEEEEEEEEEDTDVDVQYVIYSRSTTRGRK
jgi:hypothetical protein